MDASNPREQEQSIKDRKALLFDQETFENAASGPSKPFRLYLRETPPQPLSPGIKALLWTVAVVVLLLLLAAAIKSQRPKTPVRAVVFTSACARVLSYS